MSDREQDQPVQGKLVTQLGSDATYLGRGKHNIKILSIIEKRLVLPLTYLDISSKDDAGDDLLLNSLLELYISVGGRGRRDILQGEGVMKGAQPNTEAEIERPGPIARYTYQRDKEKQWKEQHGIE